jgi:hypothetical protein
LLTAPANASDEPNEKKKADDGDKVICKVDKTTGSAISERICKKRSAWQAERDNAKKYLDESRYKDFDPSKLPARPGG